MATWEHLSVKDAISKIKNEDFVLPVIQRRLVWEEESMELLFDTLLKGNSFGAVIGIEEEKDKDKMPLFAFRKFTSDGENEHSVEVQELSKKHLLVIDGQQRLQSFYIGLCGSYHGKQLYFDLYSDFKHSEYDFKFSENSDKLPKKNNERSESDLIKNCLWYPVPVLFDNLITTSDSDQVSDELIEKYGVEEESLNKQHIERNVRRFFNQIFTSDSIGISKVNVNRKKDDVENKQMIVELFRRLNDGGTKLTSYDLVASMFKGYDYKMESYLENVTEEYGKLGINQDEFIKLILILNDKPLNDLVDLTDEDAAFATNNFDRISESLGAMKNFLRCSEIEKWFLSSQKRSVIPLYFIVYHIFHSDVETGKLKEMFKNYDTSDTDYCNIKSWLHISNLNMVFSRGCGWIPYKTGVKKIHAIMKQHKGKPFPKEDIFKVYTYHPLYFTASVNENSIQSFDRNYLFYLLYGDSSSFRLEDIDHIHPKSILASLEYESSDINTIRNYQLIEIGTNRGEKNDKELHEWIKKYVKPENLEMYLERHCIPKDEELWKSENYYDFLSARTDLLINKIQKKIN